MKKVDVRAKGNVKNIASDISKSNNFGKRTKFECGTYLKKQKRSLVASWSDGSETEEATNHVTALTGRWGSEEESIDDERTLKELCHRRAGVCRQVESQKKVIA
jgi:hypothetical protein